jgi:Fe-S-cluster-containing hydrogenase component 2
MTRALAFDDAPTIVDAVPSVVVEAQADTNPVRVDGGATWSPLRTAPLFDGLPNEALRSGLLSGAARIQELARDQLLLDGADLVLVLKGQLALARFAPDVLDEERRAARAPAVGEDRDKRRKQELKRREKVGVPSARAEQNLAVFEEGDLLQPSAGAARHPGLAAYAVTPTTVALFDRGLVELWARVHPFMRDRIRRGTGAAQARLAATDGAQAAVADFFVRHGLSVSMTLRVRLLESCVDCGACEAACQSRYGHKRLSLNGRILGGLDFVDACHTCTDARCIDPCNFDAISFDPVRKEVLIKEDACTGCTLCARACPYDAIEMPELDESPLLQLRLGKEGKLAFGEGAPRKARLRRIASKCDHCASYADQACISACPTGALLEVLPSDVVPALPERLRTAARSGFDDSVAIEVASVNSPAAFTDGPSVPELGRARAPRTRLLIGLWWTVGIFAVLAAATEIALRRLWPTASLQFLLDTLTDGVDPEVALLHIGYGTGCRLAVSLGYAGTALLVTSLAYVARKRLRLLAGAGALQAWFDWHVVSSVIGCALIALHSAAKLDNWVALPFWSMMGAVASGLIGRYLATRLPASREAMELLELDRQLATLRARDPGVRAAAQWVERSRQRLARRLRRAGVFGSLVALFWLVVDDLGRGHRERVLRRALRQALPGRARRRLRREAARIACALALGERRRALVDPLVPLFRSWKAVHVPLATALAILGTLHVVLALRTL